MVTEVADPTGPDAPPVPPKRRERSARSRTGSAGRTTRRWSAAAHRWLALVVGTVLLVELVSGTILLFRPEIGELGSPALFAATPSAQPLDAGGAQAVVARERPALAVGDTVPVDGVWQVSTTDGNYGVHFGYMVPWWARIVWFAAGLVSIYLVGSGFWTWWWRRCQVRLRRS